MNAYKYGESLLEYPNEELTTGELFLKLEMAWNINDPRAAQTVLDELKDRVEEL